MSFIKEYFLQCFHFIYWLLYPCSGMKNYTRVQSSSIAEIFSQCPSLFRNVLSWDVLPFSLLLGSMKFPFPLKQVTCFLGEVILKGLFWILRICWEQKMHFWSSFAVVTSLYKSPFHSLLSYSLAQVPRHLTLYSFLSSKSLFLVFSSYLDYFSLADAYFNPWGKPHLQCGSCSFLFI